MKYLIIFIGFIIASSPIDTPEKTPVEKWVEIYGRNSIDSLIVYHTHEGKNLKSIVRYEKYENDDYVKVLDIETWYKGIKID
tara:strand:+ start:2206 stop:2451 length:246 start_codon:yes stop_codon:yes gene_type:complete